MDIRFGPFTLDERARQLRRGTQPVHLSPKAFDLLVLLVGRRPEAISKREVHERLWRDTFVSDVNLAVLIAEIRTALDDDARRPQFIRTVQRFGYAFSGVVAEVTRPRAPGLGDAMCWLAWGAERAALSNGENLVGRDPAADVRIDAVGVSRRHAMLVVSHHEVTLHDLSSKNGTYVDDIRVTSPTTLSDGIEVRFGPAVVCFRQAAGMTSTQTLNASRGLKARK